MINELLNSCERRSHCQNNFGNAVPRRSRWKRSLWTGDCEATRSGPIGLAETRSNGYVFSDTLLKKKKNKKKKKI